MIDVIVSFLSGLVLVEYVPHMFVAIAFLGLVNIIKRVIMMNF